MKRILFAALTGVLLGSGTPAAAGPVCSVLGVLQSAEQQVGAYMRADGPAARDAAAGRLSAVVAEIGPYDLAVKGLAAERDEMVRFVGTRRVMARAHSEVGAQAALLTARSQIFMASGNWLSAIWQSKGCGLALGKPLPDAKIGGTEKLTSTGFTISGGAALSLAFLLAIIGGIVGIRRYKILRIRRARRAKRFNCRVNVMIRRDHLEYEATLHDVSQMGAKFATDVSLPKGAEIQVQVRDEWIAGVIRWGNAHFTGVEFDRPLDDAELFILTWTKRKTRWQRSAPPREARTRVSAPLQDDVKRAG